MKWKNKYQPKPTNGFKSSVALLREARRATEINLFKLLGTSIHGLHEEQTEERMEK